jgi:hypothetical protein
LTALLSLGSYLASRSVSLSGWFIFFSTLLCDGRMGQEKLSPTADVNMVIQLIVLVCSLVGTQLENIKIQPLSANWVLMTKPQRFGLFK